MKIEGEELLVSRELITGNPLDVENLFSRKIYEDKIARNTNILVSLMNKP